MNQPLQEADERELQEDGSIGNVPEERFQQSAVKHRRKITEQSWLLVETENFRGFPACRFYKTV